MLSTRNYVRIASILAGGFRLRIGRRKSGDLPRDTFHGRLLFAADKSRISIARNSTRLFSGRTIST